mgnify:CR=1 FL=1
MKKTTIFLILMIFMSFRACAESNAISEQFESSGAEDLFGVVNEYFPDFDSSEILNRFIEGEALDEKRILVQITNLLLGYSKKVIKTLLFLVVCGICVSFVTNAGASLNNKNDDVGTMTGYILFASALMTFFSELISPAQNAINDISTMVKGLFGILLTSVTVEGGIITGSLIQNVLFMSASIITDVISKVFVPLTVVSAGLAAAGHMSDKIRIEGLIKITRSFIKWCISFIMIFFVGMFGLYGTAGVSIDAWVGKTAKFVIGSSIPVVGGVLSDSLGTVFATIKAVRNITGNIGIIAVIIIAVGPIVRTTVYIWSLKLCAGILEPITESRIVKLINDVTQSAVMILICLISSTLLMVINISLLLASTNMLN